jgi:demethylmenaquinone methyltransferase/2-methoxy-6-polyprenyl-1,4-benzoquinol methylase
MTAPHETIAGRYGGPDGKTAYLRSLFDRGAAHYDRVNGFGFLWSGGAYRRRALRLAGLRPGMDVLDVACGTGPIARQCVRLLRGTGSVVGVDPSAGMLAVARARVHGVEFRDGHAEALPAADGSADFLVMGFALRHVAELERAFREFRRVLRPGGRVLVLEISRPRSRLGLALARLYFRDVLPRLTRLATGSRDAHEMMSYYWETIAACVPPDAILGAMRAAGFAGVARRTELGMFSAFTANAPGEVVPTSVAPPAVALQR